MSKQQNEKTRRGILIAAIAVLFVAMILFISGCETWGIMLHGGTQQYGIRETEDFNWMWGAYIIFQLLLFTAHVLLGVWWGLFAAGRDKGRSVGEMIISTTMALFIVVADILVVSWFIS